jgi:hypothetical protein
MRLVRDRPPGIATVLPLAIVLTVGPGSGCDNSAPPPPTSTAAPVAATKSDAVAKKGRPLSKVADEDTSFHLRKKKDKGN